MTTEIIRLREGVDVVPDATGVTFVQPGRGGGAGPITAGQHAMLRLLAGTGGTRRRLTEEVTATDGPAGIAHAYALLTALWRGGWLRGTLEADGRAMVSIEPSGASGASGWPAATRFGPVPEPFGGAVVLSRFALARRSAGTLLLESPRTGAVATLHDARAALLLGRLVSPLSPQAAADLGEWAPAVLAALLDCGLAVPEESAEETEPSLRQWAPHELWFHVRSNAASPGQPWGGTAWAGHRFPPLPARSPAAGTDRVLLPVPDLDAVTATDPPLTQVIESRRSIREHDDERPIDVPRLGEFLYRTARVRRIRELGGTEVVDRPYPSGGSLHELEVYLVAGDVVGLERGLYRYDGVEHALDRLAPYEQHVAELSARAASLVNMAGLPQVVIVLSARFGRTMWKYESMAYALVLKNTGVLQASMYMVATAMRLAPCAIAGPDAGVFARATGLDPATEASVGGFVLGTTRRRPPSRREGEQPS
ncbi:SagB family peptide dehydrogenase [Streptomyces sp. NBC_01190]|uniref:SagB family peptide dehydrogenase n=1 Tax=Streptomyces sp. NBC_01190 TaxID=2903767 RepID=UPI0038663449|nr:SagB family peptide dehydrogenase [Streptomyces sp. NBC_01190]